MSYYNFRISIALIVLALMSCSEKGKYRIKWTGGPEIENCEFYFNKMHLGKGKPAFNKLMAELEYVPDTSSIRIDYPLEMGVYYEEKYGDFELLPLMRNSEELKKWRELVLRKRFSMVYSFR